MTNHYRLGTGTGNERGLLDRYQTDYGYRWTTGLSDATGGEQFYQVLDELNNVYRVSIGQYLSATPNVVTNVLVNNGGCYSTSAAPTVGFSGGGGNGASATASMTTTTSLSCPGGYTVGSVTMTSGGSGYTAQPAVSFTGSNQTTAPNAVAEITTGGSTNDQTVINAAGTGAVVVNGSNNAGTGGVVFGSGGPSETTVATISNAGNAQFNGALQVGGTAQATGTMTVRNNADAEVDYYLLPGLTTSQKGSFTYKDWNGNSQWYMVKDASNNWALNSAVGGLDSFKAYQSTNSGDTYINASNGTGHIRLNYETGSGDETDIYSGPSASLDAAFLGPTSIKLPGLAASSGYNCLQIDNSGYITNTGAACGTGSGGTSGTINSGNSGQIAYYAASGTAIGGMSTVPVTAGGTGAATAVGALANLEPGVTADGENGINVTGAVSPATIQPGGAPIEDIRNPAFAGGAICDGTTNHPIDGALQAALNALPSKGGTILITGQGPASGSGDDNCYLADAPALVWPSSGAVTILVAGTIQLGTTFAEGMGVKQINILGYGGAASNVQFSTQARSGYMYLRPAAGSPNGTLGTAVNPGTVALTNGSATVTGSGTNWTSALDGATILFGTNAPAEYTISSVASTTSMTLASNWSGSTGSGVTYAGMPTTFTPSTMNGLAAGAFVNVVDMVTCNISSISRYANVVTAVLSSACHIPANESHFTVAGVADATYDGAFTTVSSDFVTNTMTWDQTGSNSFSTGGTVTGPTVDTMETVPLTSCTGSTCTATFYRQHASTAYLGVAALEVTGGGVVQDMNISDSYGIALFGYANTYLSRFINDGFQGAQNSDVTSFSMEMTGGFSTFDKCSFSNAGNAPWSARFTNTATNSITAGGEGDNQIRDSFVADGIEEDWSAAGLVIDNTVDENSSGAFVTFNPEFYNYLNNTTGYLLRFDYDQFQDANAGSSCIVTFTQPSSKNLDAEINQFTEPPGTCTVNKYFNGTIRVNGQNSGGLTYSRTVSQGVMGTENDGKKFIGEVSGQGASLGPSVIPYPTLNVPQNLTSWSNSGCTVTGGILAPDGTFSAYAITMSSGTCNIYTPSGDTFSGTPQVGDYILYGVSTYTPNFGNIDEGGNPVGLTSNNLSGSTHFTLSSLGSTAYDSLIQNQGYHRVVAFSQVTSSDGTSGQYIQLLLPGNSNNMQDFWNPFMIYIPVVTFTATTDGSTGVLTSVSSISGLSPGMIVTCTSCSGTPQTIPTNAAIFSASGTTVTLNVNTTQAVSGATFTAQYPLAEVNRWRMELLHSDVPPNYNLPGVPATVEAISTGGYYVGSNPIIPAASALPYMGAKAYSGAGVPSDTCSATVNTWAVESNATPVAFQCSNATGSYAWNQLGGSGGSGNMNDASGTATADLFALTTSTAHVYSIDTLLSDNGTTLAYTGTGGISAKALIAGTPSSGALAALPSGAHGLASDESSTAGVPAASVCYLRADSTSNTVELSCNDVAESPLVTETYVANSSSANTINATEVNGAAVPASAGFLASNSSKQLVAASYTPANCTAGTSGSDCLQLSSGKVPASTLVPHALTFAFGQAGGAAISTGVLGYATIPFACSITGWSIEADAGTDTVKFLKVAAGTAIPTLASNSISTSGVSLATGTVIQSTTLTDFTTTAVTAGDIVAADLITTSGTGYINAQLVCQ